MRDQVLNQSKNQILLEWLCNILERSESKYLENLFQLVTKIQMLCYDAVREAVDLRDLKIAVKH